MIVAGKDAEVMEFQKIVWIRIDKQEDADTTKQFISALGEQFSGNILVKILARDTNSAASLDSRYHVNESVVPFLEEKYGTDNVKFVDERIFPVNERGLRRESLIAFERIADSLEAIGSYLALISSGLKSNNEKEIER